MKWTELRDQSCPVARALSVVGDRWTLLILRDCYFGIRRFDHFQERLGITRHVLSDRLKSLEASGILRREPYQQRPLRHEYRLTEAGKAFYPAFVAIVDWTEAHVPPKDGTSVRLLSKTSGEPIRPEVVDANTGEPITLTSVRGITPSMPEWDAKRG
ncbi:winged helix-turn-helix transcriptional regulator [Chachezhania sediminis]|uniref:winged helix-turn-helix transcriptional regulator n=1 Tax=Chachezhania sediminis TaxID=2599291 RepID=UPI00131B1E52|nr:helix-turn-helix domain-containing protein [Chachezhania sediminis]